MVPTEVEVIRGTKIRQACCGKFHTLLLSEGGDIWACGANNFGQIGNNCTQTQYGLIKLDTRSKTNGGRPRKFA